MGTLSADPVAAAPRVHSALELKETMDWKRVFLSVLFCALLASTSAETEGKSSVLESIRSFLSGSLFSSVAVDELEDSDFEEVHIADPSKNKAGRVAEKLRTDETKTLEAKGNPLKSDNLEGKNTEIHKKKKRSLEGKAAQKNTEKKRKMRKEKENDLKIKTKKSPVGAQLNDKSRVKRKVAKEEQEGIEHKKRSLDSPVESKGKAPLETKSNLKAEVAKEQQEGLKRNKHSFAHAVDVLAPIVTKSKRKAGAAKEQQKGSKK